MNGLGWVAGGCPELAQLPEIVDGAPLVLVDAQPRAADDLRPAHPFTARQPWWTSGAIRRSR
jgi:hypothetical protein